MNRWRLAYGILLAAAGTLCGRAAWGVDPRPITVVTGGSAEPADVPPAAASTDSAAASPIEFVRVRAAASAVDGLRLDAGRSIPMPLAEFDAAVAAVSRGAEGLLRPTATLADYDLTTAADGRLVGEVSFEIGPLRGASRMAMPLGEVAAQRCRVRTAVGSGEATVFGLPDGRVAVQVTGPGTYTCGLELPPLQAGRVNRIPLVPALVTTLRLRLPAGQRPVVLGAPGDSAVVEPPATAGGSWRIVVAAGTELRLSLQDARRMPPPVACWNRVSIRGRQAEVTARTMPTSCWTGADLVLAAGPDLVATTARDEAGRDLAWATEAEGLRISIPDRLAGTQAGVVVTGIVPVSDAGSQPVPGWQPLRARWAGGGTLVETAAAGAVEAIELDDCLVVTAGDAAAWPLPPGGLADALPMAGSRLFLEHQSPTAAATIAVGPREAAFDTARVTTVDLSPGTVLGRAACDVRVVAGEVFTLSATVAPGWFIDSVEAVDWQRPGTQRAEGETAEAGLEWRVVRSAERNELRIGLAAAATAARRLGLVITGHRPGVPLGGQFSGAELDMVRLPGESPELALLEFRVGPMAVIETDGDQLAVEPAEGRLAPLAGEAAPRARVRAGERAAPLVGRLVRRRPPVEAEVWVGLMARDERVAETFSFACRPVAGEIDALVVHFSEPMPTGLEWSLSEPASGSLAARRLDPGEAAAGAAMPEVGVAESWVVDVRPATAGLVRFVATRTVPLESAVPVPLAWVEAAEQPGGRVTIGGEAGQRPEVLNRRLRELPPTADDGGPAVLELAYSAPESVARGDGAAADLLPPAAASGARAWAWRESIVCQCHDSGMLEWEARLDIENQGRGSVNLSVPEGLRLEAVSVAGGAIAPSELGQSGGTMVVPLPVDRGRIDLVIRGTGRRDDRLGWWSVGGIACGVDLPILDREARLLLPPGLRLATGGDRGGSWSERLFNATLRNDSPSPEPRSIDITALTRGGVTSAVVVRRQLLSSLAILSGGIAFLAGGALACRHPPAAIIGCGLAGIAALWVAVPWDGIPRAVWWGGIGGIWAAAAWTAAQGRAAAGWWRRGASGLGIVLACLGPAARGAGESSDQRPVRVIILDEPEGGMALVPEPLFRRLAAAEAAAAVPALRVMEAELVVESGRDRWQLRLVIDADRGGSLRLPAAAGGRWLPGVGVPSTGPLAVEFRPDHVQLVSVDGGRAELTLGFEPLFAADGAIESAVMHLPAAAAARVVVRPPVPTANAVGWQCDRADSAGRWHAAPWIAGGFDVPRATRIRIVRPTRAVDRLVAQPRAAESVNDVSWRSAECRVDASFTVGGDDEIVRQLLIHADPGLEPVLGGAAVEPLGEGRYRIDLPEPEPGSRTVTASFRMPLIDPVGLFDLPGVWLEGVGTDQRTVRLRPEPGLEAAAEVPLGMTLVRPRTDDGPATAATWWSEVVAGAAEAVGEQAGRPRIAVRRRLLLPRGSQALAVTATADRIGLELDVELEAVALPLVQIPVELPEAAVVDRLVVTRRREAGEGEEPVEVDAVWSRPAAGRLTVVVQRPDTGLFQLRIDARIPGPPPLSGRLPLMRAELPGGLPLVLRWRAAPGLALELSERMPAVGEPEESWLEIPAEEPGPSYQLSAEPGASVDATTASAAPPAVAVDVGVALTDVHLALDHRGRGWGLARFDLVAAEPTLLMELPPGLRLFDVRVDGREVTALPRGESTWEVRLHDVTWPRTLVAVFAGTVSGPLADGRPIQLLPPKIVGLPSADVVWSLDLPVGYELRLAQQATPLDPLAAQAGAVRSRAWYGEAFQAAVAAADPRERAWLEAFAAARRDGEAPAGERAWYEAWQRAAAVPATQTVLEAGSVGGVTIRPVRGRDETVATRGLASALLTGVAVAAWASGRRVSAWVGRTVARWWWLACGLAWLAVLEPALPGWIMVAAGGWLAFGPGRRAGTDPTPG